MFLSNMLYQAIVRIIVIRNEHECTKEGVRRRFVSGKRFLRYILLVFIIIIVGFGDGSFWVVIGLAVVVFAFPLENLIWS
jgi:hypothetical protein